VATLDRLVSRTMDHARAKEIVAELARAGVGGISFSAGEPFLYFKEIAELVKLCDNMGSIPGLSTNSYWATNSEAADGLTAELQENGLCQLRLSYSRWHQKNINRNNVLQAARSCEKIGLNYFVSFVTDFSPEDESYEKFLRAQGLRFFPEPVIYAGRAESFPRRIIRTDYQANCCAHEPLSHPGSGSLRLLRCREPFPATNFFYSRKPGRPNRGAALAKSETEPLYNLIRTVGQPISPPIPGCRPARS